VVSMNETIKNWMQAAEPRWCRCQLPFSARARDRALGRAAGARRASRRRAIDRVDEESSSTSASSSACERSVVPAPAVVELEQIVAALKRRPVAAGRCRAPERPVAESLFIIDAGAAM